MLGTILDAWNAHVIISFGRTDVLFSRGPLVGSKRAIVTNFDKMWAFTYPLRKEGGFCEHLLQNACMYQSIYG